MRTAQKLADDIDGVIDRLIEENGENDREQWDGVNRAILDQVRLFRQEVANELDRCHVANTGMYRGLGILTIILELTGQKQAFMEKFRDEMK